MKIGIFGKRFLPEFNKHIARLFDKLKKENIEIIVYKPFYEFMKGQMEMDSNVSLFTNHKDSNELDFLISVGGDGSMLNSLNIIRDRNIPVLGVNTGRLGFLSIVGIEETDKAIDLLVQGKYEIDKRSLIEVNLSSGQSIGYNYALNEVTLHKKETSSMIIVEAQMNDEFICSYWADGLIVSTPTGSTAYSLSCGGPIVMPESDNFVLTPIAPHNLNVRPLVVSNNNHITLKAKGRDSEYLLTLDSISHTIDQNSEVNLRKADFEIQLIRLENTDFFKTIRNKLNWGLDKRN